jgi:hypothetical protein
MSEKIKIGATAVAFRGSSLETIGLINYGDELAACTPPPGEDNLWLFFPPSQEELKALYEIKFKGEEASREARETVVRIPQVLKLWEEHYTPDESKKKRIIEAKRLNEPGVTLRLRTEKALGFCATCPIIPQCLAEAWRDAENNEKAITGIFGGLTIKERERLLEEYKSVLKETPDALIVFDAMSPEESETAQQITIDPNQDNTDLPIVKIYFRGENEATRYIPAIPNPQRIAVVLIGSPREIDYFYTRFGSDRTLTLPNPQQEVSEAA